MKSILKAFFYSSKDEFFPPYFWISLFCSLAVTMLVLRFLQIGNISDGLIIGTLSFVVAWLAIYNWQKIKIAQQEVNPQIIENLKRMLKK